MRETDDLKDLFDRLNGQFEIAELRPGHEGRFVHLLNNQKRNAWNWLPYIAAACILFALLSMVFKKEYKSEKPQNYLSAESRKADSVFNANIDLGKELLLKKKSAANEYQINEALQKLQVMENEYKILQNKIRQNGENQKLVNALMLNLKTQIEFLEQTIQQIDPNQHFQAARGLMIPNVSEKMYSI